MGLLAPALLIALSGSSACRPDVELAIPCGLNGDLSCPTGYHCGAHDACEPSEVPPTIVPEENLAHQELHGTLRYHARLSSPLGIHSASIHLQSAADATTVSFPANIEFDDDSRTTAAIQVDVETWKVPDGPASLILTAHAEGGVPPSRLEVPFSIANGVPTLSVTQGNFDTPLSEPRKVTVHVSSRVGLKKLSASMGERELHPGIYWIDADRHEAMVELQLNPAGHSSGAKEVVLAATDHAHRESELRASLLIP